MAERHSSSNGRSSNGSSGKDRRDNRSDDRRGSSSISSHSQGGKPYDNNSRRSRSRSPHRGRSSSRSPPRSSHGGSSSSSSRHNNHHGGNRSSYGSDNHRNSSGHSNHHGNHGGRYDGHDNRGSNKARDLFVKIPRAWTERDLKTHFQRFGAIMKVRVLPKKPGVGFVTFENNHDGDAAIEFFNEHEMDGTIMTVAWSDTSKSKAEEFFPDLEAKDRARMQLDKEAEYSVSAQPKAEQLTNILRAWLPDATSITDGCACVGGNTISFAKHFTRVNACEYDRTRFDMLNNNLRVYQLDSKCKTFNEDFNLLLDRSIKPASDDTKSKIDQQILFCDPPWGGNNYKGRDEVPLFLGATNIWNIVRLVHDNKAAQLTVLKVPINFEWQGFLTAFASCDTNKWPQIAKIQAADWGYVFIDHINDAAIFRSKLRLIPQKGHIRYQWIDQKWNRVDNDTTTETKTLDASSSSTTIAPPSSSSSSSSSAPTAAVSSTTATTAAVSTVTSDIATSDSAA